MKPISNPYLATLLLSITAQAAAADQLADPTRPANARTPATTPVAQSLRLEAVLKSDERYLAIVNGKVVRAGDRIGDAHIDEVLSNGIRYTRSGKSQIVRLGAHAMHVRRNVVAQEEET